MNPWGRDQELEADRLGMMIIHWAGYDVSHIPSFWADMSRQNSNEHDFFSTHPADSKRIATMQQLICEIENEDDFYSKPVIGEINSSNGKHDNSAGCFCTECGAPVDVGDKFCTSCGTKLGVELKCPKCGSSIGSNDAFCMNCGYKL